MNGHILSIPVVKARALRWSILIALLLASTTPVLAHHLPPGYEDVDEFEQALLVTSFLHPLSGMDHVLLALALGWMVFAAGSRRGAVIGASFAGSLALGLVLGRTGVGVPMLELGVSVSVIAAGLLLVYAGRKWPASSILFAVLAGFWHGNAHGLHMPGGISSVPCGVALVAGTLAISVAGWLFAALCSPREEPVGRWIGAGFAVVGAWFWLA